VTALYQKKDLALLLCFVRESRISTFDRLERFERLEPTAVL